MIELSTLQNFADDVGNSVLVGENVVFRRSVLKIREKSGAIFIGSNVKITEAQIEVGQNSVIEILDGVTLSGKIFCGRGSKIKIGRNLSVTGNVTIKAAESTEIHIGDGCLFGSDIIIRSYDGHPIYDARTRIRLNSGRSISIGSHVWIADRAVILKGTKIGDASIIGLGSILCGDVPKNSVAVGNPAKVIKTGITWEHSPNDVTEVFYISNQLDVTD